MTLHGDTWVSEKGYITSKYPYFYYFFTSVKQDLIEDISIYENIDKQEILLKEKVATFKLLTGRNCRKYFLADGIKDNDYANTYTYTGSYYLDLTSKKMRKALLAQFKK